ncbi:solute carrier family 28 member 3 [Eurytemora carolleeae]|uniref:solute carrier family 28 member 3 n=1 Tax=Eurytemora carolleeae TaxID=1294199 RepID=UPI000C7754B4|nr:solute carrier family 28 member 3 [Eurytemora carolleeae]|eukprot:XP_023322440.1 solute carrier family 28 member 3-like [Eurytemora affinis]
MEFISQSQRSKSLEQPRDLETLPDAWDVTTVPKTQSPKTMEFISQSQRPKAWDSPGTWDSSKSLGQSQDVWTVPEAWDNPNFKVFDTCWTSGLSDMDVESYVDEVMNEQKEEKEEDEEKEKEVDEENEEEGMRKRKSRRYGWVKNRDIFFQFQKNSKLVRTLVLILFAGLYNAYFIAAIHYGISTTQNNLDYCTDVGFLIIITVVVYIGIIYYYLIKPNFPVKHIQKISRALGNVRARVPERLFNIIVYAVGPVSVCIFILVDTRDEPHRLYSALGIIVLIFLGFIFSKHPGYVVWRHILWGLILQFIFGLIILRWDVGRAVIGCLGNKVASFLALTNTGSSFVFGYLVDAKPFSTSQLNGTAAEVAGEINESGSVRTVFFFSVLSIIYFFNFCVAMLFYVGAMQWIVVKLGWILQVTVGTTACESVNAAANIFLGQSEAPLLIKPYLPQMTSSEIHAVMTGGFATVAGAAMAAYISFGVSASHLLTASVMSAPAALAYAKLFYPETKKSKTTFDHVVVPKSKINKLLTDLVRKGTLSILDAASNGALQAVFIVGNIGASLIAVIAFVSFVNSLLGWFGGMVGIPFLSLEYILSLVFYPLSFLMGVECVPFNDCCETGTCPDTECNQCSIVALLVGLKTIVNEFVAYEKLTDLVRKGMLSSRSEAIATYALCGFSNPASIGIQIAVLSYMAPSRRGDISAAAFRAFIAGSASCFLTACVAGTLLQDYG